MSMRVLAMTIQKPISVSANTEILRRCKPLYCHWNYEAFKSSFERTFALNEDSCGNDMEINENEINESASDDDKS
jgi:hypothetical protein